MFPLVRECAADDVLIAMLSPWHRGETPKTVDAIHRRAVEIAFNAAFLCEARLIAEATRLASRTLARTA